MVISTVIDSDRGHCYEHLKKSIYDESWACDMYLNVCVWWILGLPEIAKNKILDFSGPTCVS